jgi:acyl-coenzyme A thioesterase PaaI-like protein
LRTSVEDAMKSGNPDKSKDHIKAYETIGKAIVARKLAKTKRAKDAKRTARGIVEPVAVHVERMTRGGFIFALLLAGCCAANTPTPAPAPTPPVPDAAITGQYNLVLTSTNGHGTINLYTNFTLRPPLRLKPLRANVAVRSPGHPL